jgi:putative cell wall-binding protein
VASEPAGTDIFLRGSSDGGMTWDPEVKVNDDPAGPIQTNPWVSVGSGGEVDVIWQDRRHDYPGGRKHGDVYSARSTNLGATFAANRRITDRTINVDVGRYNDLGADFTPGFDWFGPVAVPLPGGKLLTSWTDSRLGNFDTGFQDIFLNTFNPSTGIATGNIATATTPGLSALLARFAYPGGPEAVGGNGGDPVSRVVVANEGDVAATLAGAPLARANYAPLLLSPAGGMPAVVKAEAARMRPEGGFVIGDTAALSTTVFNDLLASTRGGENVQRVAPAGSVAANNRQAETARQIAELMRPLPGALPEAVIANPASQEAASASALAAALKLPILFVDSRTTPPPPTSSAITSLGIKKALIVGGTGVVNGGVEASLVTTLGAPNVRRVGGMDVYETSEAILNEMKLRGLPLNVVYVADGARPIDGALLGSAVGRVNGGMLLTPSASTATADTRLTTAGLDAGVDRTIGAVGTGGTDPVLPPPPASGGGGLTSTGTVTTASPAPSVVTADTTAPGVSDFGLTNSVFTVGGSTPLFGSAAAKPHKRGTTFRYTLTENATVRITISQRASGRRRGTRCVAPTRALRRARKCTRIVTRGTLTRTSHAGRNSVAFSGRLGSRRLSPGTYLATLIATDAARNTSTPRTVAFRIVSR